APAGNGAGGWAGAGAGVGAGVGAVGGGCVGALGAGFGGCTGGCCAAPCARAELPPANTNQTATVPGIAETFITKTSFRPYGSPLFYSKLQKTRRSGHAFEARTGPDRLTRPRRPRQKVDPTAKRN